MKNLVKKVLILSLLSITLISCGAIETSCDVNGKNELCYGLLGDDKVNQGEYEKDQDELERFKEEVRSSISSLTIELSDIRTDIKDLRTDVESNDQELFQSVSDIQIDLQTAIVDFNANNSATLVILDGFRRKINKLRRNIRIIRNNINNLEVVCDYLDLGFRQLATYCELER